jgi:hypothetical protein
MKTIFTILLLLGLNSIANAAKLKFEVIDSKTNEAIIGASIIRSDNKVGAQTNEMGQATIETELPASFSISYMGYESKKILLKQYENELIQIELKESKRILKEANIQASKSKLSQKEKAGIISIQPNEYKFLAIAGGEKDPIQVLQLMPGLKKGANGGDGFYVRGGSADQNLIRLDGATVYNPNHLLGFFSVFNSDAIQDLKLYKGAFPATMGGRLSSVMDIRIKEADKSDWNGTAAVGLLSARGFLSGPLIKNKLGFSASFRRTYIEQLFALAGNELPYYFQDGHIKLNYNINENNKLSYTAFYGNDVLRINREKENEKQIDFGTSSHNWIQVLHFLHFNKDFSSNLYAVKTNYAYTVNANIDGNIFGLKAEVQDLQLKGDLTKQINKKTNFKTGFEFTQHSFNPNQTSIFGSLNELLKETESSRFYANEAAFFAMIDKNINQKINLNLGLRMSSSFGKNFMYVAPEPRMSLHYQIDETSGVNLSYNRMKQYLHLVSGSSAVMPTDLWFPVSKQVKPQSSNQYAISYQKEWNKSGLFLQIEPYFKTMNNLVEYKEGTQILLNNEIEKDLVQGIGRAYGIELMLQKKTGRLSGWIAYTLSWSERKFEELNRANWFYGRYDRRHDLSLVGNFQINENWGFSSTFTIGSGMRVTPMLGKYIMPSGSYNDVIGVPIYGDRNSLVLSPLHRLDVNLTYQSKPGKRIRTEWNIGACNVYNRTQAYKLSLVKNADNSRSFKQVGLYGFVPSASFNMYF